MSNFTIARNVLWKNSFRKRHLKNAWNVHRFNAARSVTVASTTEKCEDSELGRAKPFEEMPRVPMLPFIGSAWTYFPIVGRYSIHKNHKADLHKYKTYGPVVREKFGGLNVVSSFEPETMKILYQHEGKNPVRATFAALKAYRDSRKKWYTTNGLIALNGEEWYDLRFKTQKHLMKPKSIMAFLDPMQDVARDMVSLIRVKRDADKEVSDFLGDLKKWALEAVAFVGLDARFDCLNPNVSSDSDGMKIINSVQTHSGCVNKLEPFLGNFPFWKFFPTPTFKKFVKAGDDFAELAFKYINRSMDELKKRKDDDSDLTLLQTMIMSKDLDVSSAMVMVADLLMAGINTTSTTVGNFFYALAKNPEHQERLFREIQDLLPRKEDRITLDKFNKLHYLKACLKESMRMFPIFKGQGRTLDHDVAISGYRVPAGTLIFCVLQVIQRNEKYFKDANKFVPERWLDREQKLENPFAFLPFGIGTRSCIGRRLAELEMISLATEVVRNFKIEYHHEDLDVITTLMNSPDKPLKFNFLDR